MRSAKGTVDLVAFQLRLNESLDSIPAAGAGAAFIGFHCAGRNWLARLDDLREIESLPTPEKLFKLPLAKDWVSGLASFKGAIQTVVDFQRFLGGAPTQEGLSARALLIHPRHGIQAALVVGEVAGLLSSESLVASAPEEACPWIHAWHRSPDGKVWALIDMGKLAASEDMMNIGR